MSEIRTWLESLELGQYADVFEENAIEQDVVHVLTEDHLKDLGVTVLGHRLRILDAAAQLAAPHAATKPEGEQVSANNPAERRHLTVMFCDLVGSTELSELVDVEDLREILAQYQSAVSGAVHRYDGYIARHMGDGMLIYFGYPTAHEDDAERAIRAGLDTVKAVGELSTPNDLQVRIGIASGLVVAGDIIGEGASEERAVLGETPNLAARLQSIAKPNQVVIAASTRRLTGSAFDCINLGLHDLKGFSTAQEAWGVIEAHESSSRLAASRGVRRSPFVGRSEELALLVKRWKRVCEGDGQVVLFSGEPGIGKSRLVESFVSSLADQPKELRYQCSPYHVNSTLYPIIQQISLSSGFDRSDSTDVRLQKLESSLKVDQTDISITVAILANLLSIPAQERYSVLDLNPDQIKQNTLNVLLNQLETFCESQPVVLVFEDLHWIDPTSSEFLASVVEAAKRLPLLVILTFRPEFNAPWVGEAHVSLLAFNRLNPESVVGLMTGVAGGKPLPEELTQQVIEKTDGIPLFVEELTQTILESELVQEESDRYVLNGPLPPLAVPNTLQESLTARLDALAETRVVAQTAAALGREFSLQVLAAVMKKRLEELEPAILELLNSGLVVRIGSNSLMFKHALVRDAAYTNLLRSRRKSLHGRIATVLERDFPELAMTEPELLAYHYTEANLADSAVGYWLRAGERALERSAYPEAIAHLNQGLELVKELSDENLRAKTEIALRMAIGVPLIWTSFGGPEAAENYERARSLCMEFDEEEQLFSAIWGLWFGLFLQSKAREAVVFADQLLDLATNQGEEALQLQAHHCQWASRFSLGEHSKTLEHTERGIELYDPAAHHPMTYTYGGHDAGVCCRQISSLVLWLTGYPEQAQQRINDAMRLAEKLGHLNTRIEAEFMGVTLSMMCREPDSALQWTNMMLDTCPLGEYDTYFQWATGAKGWATSLKNNSEEGRTALGAALESWLASGVCWTAPLLMPAVMEMARHGEIDKALEVAKTTLELARRDEATWFEPEILRVNAELKQLHSPNNIEESEDDLKEALDIARRQGARSLELRITTNLARAWNKMDRREDAHGLLESTISQFTEGFSTPDLREASSLLMQLAR